MADENKGSAERDYRGVDGAVDDADPPPNPETRLPRGQTGGSKVNSPRRGVRDPGKPHTGSEGEPAYGTPITKPLVGDDSD